MFTIIFSSVLFSGMYLFVTLFCVFLVGLIFLIQKLFFFFLLFPVNKWDKQVVKPLEKVCTVTPDSLHVLNDLKRNPVG